MNKKEGHAEVGERIIRVVCGKLIVVFQFSACLSLEFCNHIPHTKVIPARPSRPTDLQLCNYMLIYLIFGVVAPIAMRN